MGSQTTGSQPASAFVPNCSQDPALRYVLAVGTVSAGLSLADTEHGGDTGHDVAPSPIGGPAESVISDARARAIARSWGIEPTGESGEAGGGPGTVIVLVDSLGLEMLRQHHGYIPTLRQWLAQRKAATATIGVGALICRPSTTAVALTVLGTSALPGTTGMIGYSVLNPRPWSPFAAPAVPGLDQVLSLITWKGDNIPSPRSWQDVPTIFERLPAGSAVSIGPSRFAGSGLTEAALRGASYLRADRLEDRPGLAVGVLRRGTPLVYLYADELDKTGHKHGWLSEQWLAQLERLDVVMAELARRVLAGTRILLSADHGMVDTDPDHRINLSAHRDLVRDVVAVTGEPKLTYLHAASDDVDLATEVPQHYRYVLGDRTMRIGAREQVGEHLGILGVRARGVVRDTVVAMARNWVFVGPRAHPEAIITMPGAHGSFTPAETEVPLLITEAWEFGHSGATRRLRRDYSGLAPKMISSQEGVERHERRRGFFLVEGVLSTSGRGSCIPAAEAADGPGEALARTSEREGMGISGASSVRPPVPNGVRRPTGMRSTAGLGVDGVTKGALEAVTSRAPAGWLPVCRRLRPDIE